MRLGLMHRLMIWFKGGKAEVGDIAQQFRALVLLVEDPSSSPSTLQVVHISLQRQVKEI